MKQILYELEEMYDPPLRYILLLLTLSIIIFIWTIIKHSLKKVEQYLLIGIQKIKNIF